MDIKNMTTENLQKKMKSFYESLEFYHEKEYSDREFTQADADMADWYWVFYCAFREELQLRGEY